MLLIEGSAVLTVDGEAVALTAGEWVHLPAHLPHAVVRTAAGTRWLAVHLEPSQPPSTAPGRVGPGAPAPARDHP